MSDSELLQHLDPRGVLTLTMNRPDVHNAFDDAQQQRLIEALEAAVSDPAVRVVVLAGSGKSFSAGGDLKYMRRMGNNSYQENLADAGRLAHLLKLLNDFPKPTIARVQGAAMGGGVGLVCCCDIAIGSDAARFALSEVKVGMVPATISPYVVRSIGEKAARRLFLTGEMVDAERALRVGYLSEVVAEAELDAKVAEVVQQLLNNAPEGLAKAKWIIGEVFARPLDATVVTKTVELIAEVRESDEGKEGLSAFLEKRAPAWQTR